MRQHEVIIGQAQPQMLLSPGQIFGEAQYLACKPTIALATRQVVAFDETGIDRLTDWGCCSARLHAASEPKMIFVVTSTTRPLSCA